MLHMILNAQVNGTLCPCNTPRLTSYVKFSGLLEDVQWAAQEVHFSLETPPVWIKVRFGLQPNLSFGLIFGFGG